MNIINIEHISKLFGDKLIFDDASFGLQEGEAVRFLPNARAGTAVFHFERSA